MEKRIIRTIVLLSAGIALLSACDLTENQKSSADAALVFGSETGLKLYCNSFYSFFPNGTLSIIRTSWRVTIWPRPSLMIMNLGP